MSKNKNIYIGIDTGTNTGVAVYNSTTKKFELLGTFLINQAFEVIKEFESRIIEVIVEDARQVKFRGGLQLYRQKAEGIGSIKRDCNIWEDFLKFHGVPFVMVKPNKEITKWDKKRFQMLTGYKGLTNEHSRDAGMLVYGLE